MYGMEALKSGLNRERSSVPGKAYFMKTCRRNGRLALLVTYMLSLAFVSSAAPPIRILPVGDSITYGSGAPGGYRLRLYELLTAAGYNVDFTGTQAGNGATGLPDSDHEGHGGWRIDQIDSIIEAVLDQTHDPDVILVLIGTNDYGQDYSTSTATNRLNDLVTKMATYRPHAKIIVSNLTKRGEPRNTQIQTTFNPYVPIIVTNQAALGRQVYFTDLYSDVPLSDMPDNLHPDANGYAKMATNWFTRIAEHFSPEGSTNAPALVRATGIPGLTNVLVTFSKPVSNDAAAAANYTLDGGIAVLGAALDPTTQRDVRLTTSEQTRGTLYTLSVSNVHDQTAARTPIADGASTTFTAEKAFVRGASNNVEEAGTYQLVYSLDIPNSPGYLGGVTYTEDHRTSVSNFARIAYYLELQPTGGDLEYVWVSMDRFSTNVAHIGVPTVPSGAVFRQPITNMTVISGTAGIANGTNMGGGNIEFWPSNYNALDSAHVPGASDSAYDFGDNPTPGTYGSMQVHNHAVRQVLLAFNHWGGNGSTACVGIGNRPGQANIDWTFADNAGDFSIKTLQVYVAPLRPGAAPVLLSANPVDLHRVTLVFSRPIDGNATNVANYALSGGLTVLSAVLNPMSRTGVTLTTSQQSPLTRHVVTVNNVRNLSSDHATVAPDSTALFTAPAGRGVFVNVPGILDWQLVYSLDIPNQPNYIAGVPYDVDAHAFATNYSRVGYYLELQESGEPVNFMWATMDAFTTHATQIGVPTVPSGAIFQQPVTNLSVRSSVAGIVGGTNMTGGNIEFWPSNYGASNAVAVPNASHTAYDFGDVRTAGNHGSMQIHNHVAQQVLLAFNRWGGAGGNADMGIGNRPGTADIDWTFAQNAATYAVKTLQVFVLPPTNTAPPEIVGVRGVSGWTNVIVTFSKPLEEDAANADHYALDGGVTVLAAALEAASKAKVTLTTTPQTPGTLYTVTVNGIRDRTDAHTEIAPDSTATFRAYYAQGVFNNVREAANYTLIYTLPIPNRANFRGTNSPPYTLDHAGRIVNGYDRVAYYMELDTGTALQWVYASMDDFTGGAVRALGLPHGKDNPVLHQRIVNNMNILASVGSGIVTGTNVATGNIEMWPSNYGAGNGLPTPNASGSLFDWGDSGGTIGAGHGTFQVHNHGAILPDGTTGQVLFAYNDWGGNNANGNSELGIGNNPGAHPDWTHQDSTHIYSVKNLHILVRETRGTKNPVDVIREETGEALPHHELVYELDIPDGPQRFNTLQVPYKLNRSGILPPGIARIAYFLELEMGGTRDWVLVSMEAFTQLPHQTGVPGKGIFGNGNLIFRQPVTNMNVYASAGAGVTTGEGTQTGNIEFFPSNYQQANSGNVPNASGSVFDFGDNPSNGDYGCLQVHNHDLDGDAPGTAGETILAYNRWGNSATQSDVGIGNRQGDVNTDWTFAQNANTYTYKNLNVLVLPSVYANVPEAAGYSIVYALDIPNDETTDFHNRGVPYTLDRSIDLAGMPFNRIAYYLELKKPGEQAKWVFVSTDAFTNDLSKIGVPNRETGVRWQMGLSSMNIHSSTNSDVTDGTGISSGTIEFWPNNYGVANEVAVPGASGSTFDFGDDVTENVPNGHGSMQIHNPGAGEVIFAYNAWGTPGRIGAVGIGNQPTGHPDWTFSESADDYEIKTLLVLVNTKLGGTMILVR